MDPNFIPETAAFHFPVRYHSRHQAFLSTFNIHSDSSGQQTGFNPQLVDDLLLAEDIPLLTQIVCQILDRQRQNPHSLLPHVSVGSRHAENLVKDKLGINQGQIPVSATYIAPLIALSRDSLSTFPNPIIRLDLIDFIRILRSRTDWTSTTFYSAVKTSPFQQYSKQLQQLLSMPGTILTEAQVMALKLQYLLELTFFKYSPSYSLWGSEAYQDVTQLYPLNTIPSISEPIQSQLESESFPQSPSSTHSDTISPFHQYSTISLQHHRLHTPENPLSIIQTPIHRMKTSNQIKDVKEMFDLDASLHEIYLWMGLSQSDDDKQLLLFDDNNAHLYPIFHASYTTVLRACLSTFLCPLSFWNSSLNFKFLHLIIEVFVRGHFQSNLPDELITLESIIGQNSVERINDVQKYTDQFYLPQVQAIINDQVNNMQSTTDYPSPHPLTQYVQWDLHALPLLTQSRAISTAILLKQGLPVHILLSQYKTFEHIESLRSQLIQIASQRNILADSSSDSLNKSSPDSSNQSYPPPTKPTTSLFSTPPQTQHLPFITPPSPSSACSSSSVITSQLQQSILLEQLEVKTSLTLHFLFTALIQLSHFQNYLNTYVTFNIVTPSQISALYLAAVTFHDHKTLQMLENAHHVTSQSVFTLTPDDFFTTLRDDLGWLVQDDANTLSPSPSTSRPNLASPQVFSPRLPYKQLSTSPNTPTKSFYDLSKSTTAKHFPHIKKSTWPLLINEVNYIQGLILNNILHPYPLCTQIINVLLQSNHHTVLSVLLHTYNMQHSQSYSTAFRKLDQQHIPTEHGDFQYKLDFFYPQLPHIDNPYSIALSANSPLFTLSPTTLFSTLAKLNCHPQLSSAEDNVFLMIYKSHLSDSICTELFTYFFSRIYTNFTPPQILPLQPNYKSPILTNPGLPTSQPRSHHQRSQRPALSATHLWTLFQIAFNNRYSAFSTRLGPLDYLYGVFFLSEAQHKDILQEYSIQLSRATPLSTFWSSCTQFFSLSYSSTLAASPCVLASSPEGEEFISELNDRFDLQTSALMTDFPYRVPQKPALQDKSRPRIENLFKRVIAYSFPTKRLFTQFISQDLDLFYDFILKTQSVAGLQWVIEKYGVVPNVDVIVAIIFNFSICNWVDLVDVNAIFALYKQHCLVSGEYPTTSKFLNDSFDSFSFSSHLHNSTQLLTSTHSFVDVNLSEDEDDFDFDHFDKFSYGLAPVDLSTSASVQSNNSMYLSGLTLPIPDLQSSTAPIPAHPTPLYTSISTTSSSLHTSLPPTTIQTGTPTYKINFLPTRNSIYYQNSVSANLLARSHHSSQSLSTFIYNTSLSNPIAVSDVDRIKYTPTKYEILYSLHEHQLLPIQPESSLSPPHPLPFLSPQPLSSPLSTAQLLHTQQFPHHSKPTPIKSLLQSVQIRIPSELYQLNDMIQPNHDDVHQHTHMGPYFYDDLLTPLQLDFFDHDPQVIPISTYFPWVSTITGERGADQRAQNNASDSKPPKPTIDVLDAITWYCTVYITKVSQVPPFLFQLSIILRSLLSKGSSGLKELLLAHLNCDYTNLIVLQVMNLLFSKEDYSALTQNIQSDLFNSSFNVANNASVLVMEDDPLNNPPPTTASPIAPIEVQSLTSGFDSNSHHSSTMFEIANNHLPSFETTADSSISHLAPQLSRIYINSFRQLLSSPVNTGQRWAYSNLQSRHVHYICTLMSIDYNDQLERFEAADLNFDQPHHLASISSLTADCTGTSLTYTVNNKLLNLLTHLLIQSFVNIASSLETPSDVLTTLIEQSSSLSSTAPPATTGVVTQLLGLANICTVFNIFPVIPSFLFTLWTQWIGLIASTMSQCAIEPSTPIEVQNKVFQLYVDYRKEFGDETSDRPYTPAAAAPSKLDSSPHKSFSRRSSTFSVDLDFQQPRPSSTGLNIDLSEVPGDLIKDDGGNQPLNPTQSRNSITTVSKNKKLKYYGLFTTSVHPYWVLDCLDMMLYKLTNACLDLANQGHSIDLNDCISHLYPREFTDLLNYSPISALHNYKLLHTFKPTQEPTLKQHRDFVLFSSSSRFSPLFQYNNVIQITDSRFGPMCGALAVHFELLHQQLISHSFGLTPSAQSQLSNNNPLDVDTVLVPVLFVPNVGQYINGINTMLRDYYHKYDAVPLHRQPLLLPSSPSSIMKLPSTSTITPVSGKTFTNFSNWIQMHYKHTSSTLQLQVIQFFLQSVEMKQFADAICTHNKALIESLDYAVRFGPPIDPPADIEPAKPVLIIPVEPAPTSSLLSPILIALSTVAAIGLGYWFWSSKQAKSDRTEDTVPE